MNKSLQILLLMSLLLMSIRIEAGNPPPLFDKPVKVDDSGRPLYNSWERYEYERQKRYNTRPVTKTSKPTETVTTTTTTVTTQTVGSSNSVQPVETEVSSGSQSKDNTSHNGATAPTPSSVIINRPVQNTGDPEIKLNDFNF